MEVEESQWLDVDAAAKHLGMSPAFVRKCVLQNRIRHYRVGRRLRFLADDLDDFVRSGQVDVEHDPIEAMPLRRNPANG